MSHSKKLILNNHKAPRILPNIHPHNRTTKSIHFLSNSTIYNLPRHSWRSAWFAAANSTHNHIANIPKSAKKCLWTNGNNL